MNDALAPLTLLMRFRARSIAHHATENAISPSAHPSPIATLALKLSPGEVGDGGAAVRDDGEGVEVAADLEVDDGGVVLRCGFDDAAG